EADFSQQRRPPRRRRRAAIVWRSFPGATRGHDLRRILDHSVLDRVRCGRPGARAHGDAPLPGLVAETATAGITMSAAGMPPWGPSTKTSNTGTKTVAQ